MMRLKAISPQTQDRAFQNFKNIYPVTTASASFSNPIEELNGLFHVNLIGVPRVIHIKYKGDININKSFAFSPHIDVNAYYKNNHIMIRNRKTNSFSGRTLLFEYFGKIEFLKRVIVYAYNGRPIHATIDSPNEGNFNQIEATFGSCEDTFGDDTLLNLKLQDINKRRKSMPSMINNKPRRLNYNTDSSRSIRNSKYYFSKVFK